MTQASPSQWHAYVGCRTSRERHARGRGIGVYAVDAHTGALTLVQCVEGLVNPSYLAVSGDGRHLYTVHGDGHEVTAFDIDAAGRLDRLGTTDTGGRNPVHLAFDAGGRHLVIANHLSSSLAVMAVDPAGEVAAPTQLITLQGTPGPHRVEQPFAKPHQVVFDPVGRFVVVPDKGLDRVFVFRFEDGALVPAATPWVSSREGAGPRHAVFHPGGGFGYCVNELDSTVAAYRVDPDTGAWLPQQILSTLPERFTGNSRAAAVIIDSGGRYLYASNRGSDTIAVFAVTEDGLLRAVQHIPSDGRTPRCLALSPDDRWLYALNEDSDSVVVFAVDAATGALSDTGVATLFESPVCLVFRPGAA